MEHLTGTHGIGGGPVGLDTLAATIGEESTTVEDVYEPYLMQIGFLNRTPKGRTVTKLAYEHFGIPITPQKTEKFKVSSRETKTLSAKGGFYKWQ